MDAIRNKWRALAADERGVTVIEYGLIASLIIIAIMSSMEGLGGGVGGMWTQLAADVTAY